MNHKKKGVLEVKVESNMVFERHLPAYQLKQALVNLRRELAFLLNRYLGLTQHEVSYQERIQEKKRADVVELQNETEEVHTHDDDLASLHPDLLQD